MSLEALPEEQINRLRLKFNDIGVKFTEDKPIKVPWFPTQVNDINNIGKVLLEVKDEVNKDHLQFSDLEYRKRRDYIAEIAKQYKMNQ